MAQLVWPATGNTAKWWFKVSRCNVHWPNLSIFINVLIINNYYFLMINWKLSFSKLLSTKWILFRFWLAFNISYTYQFIKKKRNYFFEISSFVEGWIPIKWLILLECARIALEYAFPMIMCTTVSLILGI